ncbi:MAG TPA: hypothetical protein DEB10_05925 [Ruminococcaceae bacterium]|nr:hypothetical protein [Oscillospiraceae bacterium]
MNYILKRTICLVLSVVLLLSISTITLFAESETTMNITLRIEGIDANIFYDTVEVPYTDTLTLQAALQYVDAQEDSITITGLDSGYISDINDEAGGVFGGWDGWLYKVNFEEPVVGIDGVLLQDGDNVLLYYGDPYGVGMQFPVADTSRIVDGIIKFTSSDTTFDQSFNPVITVNPVVGATVTWYYGNSSATYTTDSNGEIKIAAAQITEGAHRIQVAKTGESGIPLVLRFASDFTVTVTENNSQTTSWTVIPTTTSTVATQTESSSPQTGDITNPLLYLLSIILTGIIMIVGKGRIYSYEK